MAELPRHAPVTDQVHAARSLVRAARSAVLATQEGGVPYAALVTPAALPDLSIVVLLSGLSQHTRQLRANADCALLCVDTPGVSADAAPALVNPQSWARCTLTCTAAADPDPALRDRYLRQHPYAAVYAGLNDFTIWRLRPTKAQFVGGFAQAWSIDGTALQADAAAARSIAAAEPEILRHCNTDHAAAMGAIGRAHTGVAGAWRLIGVDVDGCDLQCDAAAARVAWPQAAASVAELHSALVTAAGDARRIG